MEVHAGSRIWQTGPCAAAGEEHLEKWPVENPAPTAWVVAGVVFVGVNGVFMAFGADSSPAYLAALLAAFIGWLTLISLTRVKERRAERRR